jgi:hypothetical protein
MWLKLDDEKTSLHTEEEVKRTAGGADGPIAYVCIYGAPLCPFSPSFSFLPCLLVSFGGRGVQLVLQYVLVQFDR